MNRLASRWRSPTDLVAISLIEVQRRDADEDRKAAAAGDREAPGPGLVASAARNQRRLSGERAIVKFR